MGVMEKAVYSRVLLKLSGEALKGEQTGETIDPAWRTSSPRTMRRALWRRCVAVWLHAV